MNLRTGICELLFCVAIFTVNPAVADAQTPLTPALTFIPNARTPTLIFDGLDDTSNPVGQSKGLYRALKYFGVETEMVLYPGEGHSPRRMSYNVDMFERILDWYDRHLKKTH